MREILFRGKRIRSGEWAFGDLVQVPEDEYYTIWPQKPVSSVNKVDPKTIGQYTGMKDKNDKRIFEGDVVRFLPERDCIVEWDDGCYWVVPAKPDHPDPLTGSDLQHAYVVGNIHDNPELMEE